ncbi:putative F-box-like domain superfamily protein [Helianthus anomalus]
MVYIPFDVILFEILIRLNGRDIEKYKCVCKQWNEGLSSWSFEWLHVNNGKKICGNILNLC